MKQSLPCREPRFCGERLSRCFGGKVGRVPPMGLAVRCHVTGKTVRVKNHVGTGNCYAEPLPPRYSTCVLFILLLSIRDIRFQLNHGLIFEDQSWWRCGTVLGCYRLSNDPRTRILARPVEYRRGSTAMMMIMRRLDTYSIHKRERRSLMSSRI